MARQEEKEAVVQRKIETTGRKTVKKTKGKAKKRMINSLGIFYYSFILVRLNAERCYKRKLLCLVYFKPPLPFMLIQLKWCNLSAPLIRVFIKNTISNYKKNMLSAVRINLSRGVTCPLQNVPQHSEVSFNLNTLKHFHFIILLVFFHTVVFVNKLSVNDIVTTLKDSIFRDGSLL